MKLKTILLGAMVCLQTMAFAQERICFGVYLNEDFASDFADRLEKADIPAAIVEIERYPGSVYLYVVSQQEFSSRAEGEAYKNRLLKETDLELFENNTLSVRTFKNPQFLPRPQREPEISPLLAEQKSNDSTPSDFPLNEEQPYSLFLEGYREEQEAQKSQKQLKRKEIDSYIVKKYDDETLLSFDLHSGAFATEEEAAAYQQTLKEKGLASPEIQHLDDFQNEIDRFNTISRSEKIVSHQEDYDLPEEIPSLIVQQLSYLPLHDDYSLERLFIADFVNIKKVPYGATVLDNFGLKEFESQKPDFIENMQACTFAVYENALFDKSLFVGICSTNEELDLSLWNEAQIIYKSQQGLLRFYQSEEGELLGFSQDNRHLIILKADNFTKAEWADFISCAWQKSDRLIFPEIRHSLFILPKTNDENRIFLTFELSRVGESYAEERGKALWARQMVGHWNANYTFDTRGAYSYIAFFNMDYELNAHETHKLFRKNHEIFSVLSQWNISQEKRVGKMTGWFLEKTDEENELSFSYKPYIIAVGSSFLKDRMLSDQEIE